ncbi:MAG TPA: transposase [Chthoniobacterales bacterium]
MTAEQDVDDTARKARLRRPERVFVPAPIYFITANASNRRSIFAIPEIHCTFLEFAELGEDRGAFIGAYVLMPDHIHLFVALDPETKLAVWVKSLKNSLSKTLRSLNVPAPHWQKGFFDHVLRSGDSYAQKWEYVRDNPVRAGLAKAWREWPFSGEIHLLEYRD